MCMNQIHKVQRAEDDGQADVEKMVDDMLLKRSGITDVRVVRLVLAKNMIFHRS